MYTNPLAAPPINAVKFEPSNKFTIVNQSKRDCYMHGLSRLLSLPLARPVGLLLLACALMGSILLVSAQETTRQPQTYTIHAGASGPGNVRLLNFYPPTIQVHRGDTIVWQVHDFHNMRFDTEPLPLFVEAEAGGVTELTLNAAILYPDVENGAAFQGAEINTGAPVDENAIIDGPDSVWTFSVVMDAEPGLYVYLCDIHPGMIGTITIVEAGVDIPGPETVAADATEQMQRDVYTGFEMSNELEQHHQHGLTPPAEGVATVQTGLQQAGISVDRFFPEVTVIRAGESVTWVTDSDGNVPHSITWPYQPREDFFSFQANADGVNMLVVDSVLLVPTVENGGDWGSEGFRHSGVLLPGDTFTARFPEPGVYPFMDVFERGMTGVVVVLEADE